MKNFLIFAIGALFIYACSKTSINEDVPTPTQKVYKVGDTCLGGYVFRKTGDYHGFVVKNTDQSAYWDSAKSWESKLWKLPTCADMDSVFNAQDKTKISFKISGIYWTNGIKGNKYQIIYKRGNPGGPCYEIPISNKINIAYIRQF